MQELTEAIRETCSRIEELYNGEDPFRGIPFREYRSCLTSLGSTTTARGPIQLEAAVEGEEATAHWVTAECSVQLHAKALPTGRAGRPAAGYNPVSKAGLEAQRQHVEGQLQQTAAHVVTSIRQRFPANEQLEALAVVYPHFHDEQRSVDDADVEKHVDTIIAHWGVARTLADGTAVPPMLNADTLREQAGDYIAVAKEAADRARAAHAEQKQRQTAGVTQRTPGGEGDVKERRGPALITLFWRILSSAPNFEARLSEWGKVAEIAITMVGGSVSDERTFSCMNLVTGEQRASLSTHLELCVRFAELDMALGDFPLLEAVAIPLDR